MRILLLNQCFYPDVVSTAQHAADLALALTDAGHEVTAIASTRGYDDPTIHFPHSESWKGVRIRRVPCLAVRKRSRLGRILNFASFFTSCAARLFFSRRYDTVIALTSPPLISVLAAVFTRLRGGSLVFWVMDLNPDEAIAAGWLRPGSKRARSLESLLRFSTHSASRVVVLDRFMRERLLAKEVLASRLSILPPWSHDSHISYDHPGRARFRAQHRLAGKFVVMYSGNHSPCHPLDTLLQAALELKADDNVRFCFVGGGSEYPKVKAFAVRHSLTNTLCLPYQPIDALSASLSAADLHVIVMGAPFAGLVHPCKIYNILTTGIPALFIGPDPSHIADIAASSPDLPLARFAHGDVTGVVRHIQDGAASPPVLPNEQMRRIAVGFSANRIVPQWVALLEDIKWKTQKTNAFLSAEEEVSSVDTL